MAKDYFLDDPNLDKVLKVVMALAREAYVTRDRMALIERKLNEQGILSTEQLDAFQPTAEEQQQIEKDRDEFIAALLGPIVEK